MNEELLGGLGYTEFFLSCASSLKTEEVMRRSPVGKSGLATTPVQPNGETGINRDCSSAGDQY